MRRSHFPVSLRGGQVVKPTPELVEIVGEWQAARLAAIANPCPETCTRLGKAEANLARRTIEAIPVADNSALVARLRACSHWEGLTKRLWDLCDEAADALEGKSNG